MTAVDGASDAVRLTGSVRRPGSVGWAELRALPQYEREVTFSCRTSGLRRHRFRGPLLREVVGLAAPAFGSGERRERLAYLVSLRAADGHRVVLCWAEIDPEFGNLPVLLGLVRDGVPLDGEGPQLVMPGDVCGSRNISRVTQLRVVAAPLDPVGPPGGGGVL